MVISESFFLWYVLVIKNTMLRAFICADNQATILVKGILAQDTDSSLKLFFSNERRNEGGPLADMIINRDLQAAVVTFEQEEGASLFLCIVSLDDKAFALH